MLTQAEKFAICALARRVALKPISQVLDSGNRGAACTDGKKIQLPISDTRHSLYDLEGLAAHEGAHVRFRSILSAEMCQKICPQSPNLGRDMINILEDHRIEMLVDRAYPGCGKELRNFNRKNCEVLKARITECDKAETLTQLIAIYSATGIGITEMPTNTDGKFLFAGKANKVFATAVKAIAELDKELSFARMLISAKKICTAIVLWKQQQPQPQPPQPQPPQPQPPQPQPNSDESEDDDSEGGDGASSSGGDSEDDSEDSDGNSEDESEDESDGDSEGDSNGNSEGESEDSENGSEDGDGVPNTDPISYETQQEDSRTSLNNAPTSAERKELEEVLSHLDDEESLEELLKKAQKKVEKLVEEAKSVVMDAQASDLDNVNIIKQNGSNYRADNIITKNYNTIQEVHERYSQLSDGESLTRGFNTGRLSMRDLPTALAGGSGDVFLRMDTDTGATIMILVDHSGSMDGSKIRSAEEAAIILVEALKGTPIKMAVLGFNSDGDRIIEYQYKSFDDEPDPSKIEFYSSGCNKDGWSIRSAIRQFPNDGKRQILIIVSDGMPSSYDNIRFGIKDTHDAVKEAEKQGIAVFALSMDFGNNSYLGNIYSPNHYFPLSDPCQLPTRIVELVENLVQA